MQADSRLVCLGLSKNIRNSLQFASDDELIPGNHFGIIIGATLRNYVEGLSPLCGALENRGNRSQTPDQSEGFWSHLLSNH